MRVTWKGLGSIPHILITLTKGFPHAFPSAGLMVYCSHSVLAHRLNLSIYGLAGTDYTFHTTTLIIPIPVPVHSLN